VADHKGGDRSKEDARKDTTMTMHGRFKEMETGIFLIQQFITRSSIAVRGRYTWCTT